MGDRRVVRERAGYLVMMTATPNYIVAKTASLAPGTRFLKPNYLVLFPQCLFRFRPTGLNSSERYTGDEPAVLPAGHHPCRQSRYCV